MQRPAIQKTTVDSLKYWISPNSASINYTSKITDDENAKIKKWVNDNYWLYSDAYKTSVYNDAIDAVIDRKTKLEKNEIKEKERKERKEKASYVWNDYTKQQEKQIAKAELAISDAARIIRQWQEANGIRPNMSLTDKETVNDFLKANTEKPFAEYVNMFLDNQINDREGQKTWNQWLAAKLWLDQENEKSINRKDNISAAVKWTSQWFADLLQNTFGTAATYVWNKVWAWLWEAWYWVADKLWADTSEWTVWDKMKKAKSLTWKEARDEANSEEMWAQWILQEDMPYFNWGRVWWEMATDLAVSIPASMIWWAAIWSSTLPTAAKRLLQWVNAAAWWADFEIMDNIATNNDNIFENADRWALYWLWTAWVMNWLWKLLQMSPKLLNNKLWQFLFWPKWQTKNAVLRTTPEEWNYQSKVNSIASKDANADVNFYTEFSKDLKDAWTKAFEQRVSKWQELWKARNFDLQYKPWENYTLDDALGDINKSLKEISNSNRFGNSAWEVWKEPQLFFNKETWKIDVTNPEALANMSSEITSKNWTVKTVNLLDEINDAYNKTFGAWAKQNATTVDEFIRNLNWIMEKSWNWWPKNFLNLAQEWVRWARNNINSKLTEDSLNNVEKLAAEDADIIRLTNAFNDLVWDLEKWVGWYQWAEKALKWNASVEELFRKINKATWVDLNNKILSWAYNMSMYDLQKGRDIIEYFYPSKAWLIESIIKTVTWPVKQSVAKDMIEKQWRARVKNANKTLNSSKASAAEKEEAQKVLDKQQEVLKQTEKTEIEDIVRILNDNNSPEYMVKNAKKRAKEILKDKGITNMYSLKNNKWPVWWFISDTLGDYIEEIFSD